MPPGRNKETKRKLQAGSEHDDAKSNTTSAPSPSREASSSIFDTDTFPLPASTISKGKLPLTTLSLLVRPTLSSLAQQTPVGPTTPPILDSPGGKIGLPLPTPHQPDLPTKHHHTIPIRTTNSPRTTTSITKKTQTVTRTKSVPPRTSVAGSTTIGSRTQPTLSSLSTTMSLPRSSSPGSSLQSTTSGSPSGFVSSSSSFTSSIPSNQEDQQDSASSGLFQNKAEEGVVFTFVGIAILALLAAAIYLFRRHRRLRPPPPVKVVALNEIVVPKTPSKPPKNGTVEPYPVVLLQRSAPNTASGVGGFLQGTERTDEELKKHFTIC